VLTEEQQRQIALEEKRIDETLQRIIHRVVVFSGKGGVGKTTVSVNLSFGLSLMGNRTGLLDADVTGPNVPKMLGIQGNPEVRGGRFLPHVCHGVRVMSIAGLLPPDRPLIWRGPLRSKLLHQFLTDVEWGDLDYLVADLPPGTGDEIITITQKMKPDLAVIVTTPQEVSLIDCSRALTMAAEMKIAHIGLIENMSGLICPECGARIDLFGSGGGSKVAERFQVPFFGTLPFDLEVRKTSDAGRPIVLEQGLLADAFRKIAATLDQLVQHDERTSSADTREADPAA
jgi:ATP-binding protein involved in chromosome partitioning